MAIAKRIVPSSAFSLSTLYQAEESFKIFWKKPIPFSKIEMEECQSWLIPLLPCSLEKLYKKIENIRKSFSTKPMRIKTKDGLHLSGTFFQHRKNSSYNIPTFIVFPASGELHQMGCYSWLLDLVDQPMNLLAFDYRGCGRSEGHPSGKGLINDGIAVLEHTKSLGIDEHNLVLYAFSLGGAVAAEALKRSPLNKCKIILDRTFRSLPLLIKLQLNGGLLGRSLSFLSSLVGWNYRPETALQYLPQKLLLFYSADDLVIPLKASLYTAWKNENISAFQLIESSGKEEEPHNLPLPYFRDAANNLIKFIF